MILAIYNIVLYCTKLYYIVLQFKRQNEKAYKELEKAQEAFSKADQDPQSPKIDVEKVC